MKKLSKRFKLVNIINLLYMMVKFLDVLMIKA